MRELGYVEGQNILVEGRFYGDHTERLPALAAQLVQIKVDVIVAGAAPAPEAAQRATSTTPIVMAIHADPVGSGLVASLAKPGKNVTGLSILAAELVGKRLQLLKEAIPEIYRVAVLSNPTDTTQALLLREAQAAAPSLKVRLQVLEARAPSDFAGAFSAMTKERAGGVIVLTSSMFYDQRTRIAELAARSRLPSIYSVKDYAEAGGLMAYGVNLARASGVPPATWTRSSRASSPRTCPWSSPPRSISSSTSRPPRRLASPFRSPSYGARTT
jgi:putative ABC transport system substrate-binding protein